MEPRFEYAGPYKTRERAEAALEHCFATGEVVEGERPEVESRKTPKGRRWFVTLPM